MLALTAYNSLQNVPGGKKIFSKIICTKAPYFGSISPLVDQLQPNHAKVIVKKHRAVTNHLNTVHAIAMCNMAELAGGLMTEVSVPKGARWIPAGMTVEYKRKAKTDLTAYARGSDIDWHTTGNVVIPVDILDTDEQVVFSAQITMNIKQSTKK